MVDLAWRQKVLHLARRYATLQRIVFHAGCPMLRARSVRLGKGRRAMEGRSCKVQSMAVQCCAYQHDVCSYLPWPSSICCRSRIASGRWLACEPWEYHLTANFSSVLPSIESRDGPGPSFSASYGDAVLCAWKHSCQQAEGLVGDGLGKSNVAVLREGPSSDQRGKKSIKAQPSVFVTGSAH